MKDENGFIKRDPAVEAAIYGGDKRQAERSMPVASRKKVKRERAKAEARKGQRALYDIPEWLIEAVKKVAAERGTSASQVAKYAIWEFLKAEKTGSSDLGEYLVPASKNPRFDFVIELPNDE
jgi:hypothetical protein